MPKMRRDAATRNTRATRQHGADDGVVRRVQQDIGDNRTRTGALACAFGTPWLDHFEPPTGTGKGCLWCAGEQR